MNFDFFNSLFSQQPPAQAAYPAGVDLLGDQLVAGQNASYAPALRPLTPQAILGQPELQMSSPAQPIGMTARQVAGLDPAPPGADWAAGLKQLGGMLSDGAPQQRMPQPPSFGGAGRAVDVAPYLRRPIQSRFR